jgi:proteic killer suppression protein
VIKSFRHAGIEKFFLTGSKAGIQPDHATRLGAQLLALNRAKSPEDLRLSGWGLHSLRGDLAGQWAIKVNANWRLTFGFEKEDVVLLDYRDYH